MGYPDGYEPVAVLALGYLGDPESLPEDLRTRETAVRTRKPLRGERWQLRKKPQRPEPER